jgi:Polysaccharide biosynthesis enzyme WcbI
MMDRLLRGVRASGKGRLKAAIYGTCHADALRRCVELDASINNTFEFIRLRPCFEMSEREIVHFEEDIAPTLSLFLYQPVSGARMGERLAASSVLRHLSPSCLTVSFQYLHFEAYNPFVNYPERGMDAPPFDYLDFVTVSSFLKGVDASEATTEAEAELLTSHDVAELTSWSLAELQQREYGDTGAVDITLTDFIAERYRSHRLFHTMNHPTNIVFDYLRDRVIDRLAQSGTLRKSSTQQTVRSIDPLDIVTFPCSPEVYRYGACTFPTRSLSFKGRRVPTRKMVARTYRYLAGQPRDAVEASFQKVAEKRPWFAALRQ